MKAIIKFLPVIILSLAVYIAKPNGNVSILMLSPKQIEAGHEFIVKIAINKIDIKGFSKFEIVFPAGYIVDAIETSGSTFVIKDNKAKFIWIELPNKESLEISYKVKVPVYSNGIKDIPGGFYYVDGNKKYIQQVVSRINVINNNIAYLIKVPRNVNKSYDNILSNIINYNKVIYRVKVGEFKNQISDELKADLFQQPERLIMEVNENSFVYYAADFFSYEAAKLFVELYKLKHATIEPYYKGQLLNLSEALEMEKELN
ncbi:MAG: hypothetical protein Kow0068_01690 [Marinilabiliales bacterium]